MSEVLVGKVGQEMTQIMLRHAEDDFAALLIANAMENVGAEVFSVVSNGTYKPIGFGSSVEKVQFIVWAKVKDDEHIARVDTAIELAFGE
jgi:hypothetical protein